jgi:hypothetical protein
MPSYLGELSKKISPKDVSRPYPRERPEKWDIFLDGAIGLRGRET